MIFTLVWENVRFKPVRTLLSVLLIAVPVTLILTLIGLSRGFLDDSARRSQGVGADIVFRAPGTSVMTFSGAALPEKLTEVLTQTAHVTQATGVVNQPIGGFDSVTGIDPAGFTRMSGGFIFREGRIFEKPDEVVVDQFYADQRHLHAGSVTRILNRDWHVSGIVEPGKLAHLFVDVRNLQDLVGATGKLSQIYLKLDDPSNTPQVIQALQAKFDGYAIYSMKELVSLISVNNIPLLAGFINAVVGIGVIIGFAVVSLSMYMAVLQRTREIGILKSLGATNGFVMGIIVSEAAALGFGGTIAGILLSFVTRWAMLHIAPASLPQAVVPSWWPIAGLIAMGGALLGSVYPGLMAVRQDPIEALAYE